MPPTKKSVGHLDIVANAPVVSHRGFRGVRYLRELFYAIRQHHIGNPSSPESARQPRDGSVGAGAFGAEHEFRGYRV